MNPDQQVRPSAPPGRANADVRRQRRPDARQPVAAAANDWMNVWRRDVAATGIADRAYWLVHDDWRGDLRTSARAADVIVAAALLAELIGAEAIDLRNRAVRVFTPHPPLDLLQCEVVAQLAAEPGITAVDAIDGLAPSVRDRVAARLIRSGAADVRRVGWRRRRLAVARAGDTGPAWVRAGLATAVEQGLPLSQADCVLLQLVRYSSLAGNPLTAASADRMATVLRRLDGGLGRYGELVQAAIEGLRAAAVAR